jgi:hypothetical protein
LVQRLSWLRQGNGKDQQDSGTAQVLQVSFPKDTNWPLPA